MTVEEITNLNIESAVILGAWTYDGKDLKEVDEEDEYLLIDNPINRITYIKY